MQSRFSSASLSFMSADRTFQKLFLGKTVEWILIAFYNVSPMSWVEGGVCSIQHLTIIPKIKCYCLWIQIYLSSKKPKLSYYFIYSWGREIDGFLLFIRWSVRSEHNSFCELWTDNSIFNVDSYCAIYKPSF